MNSEKKVVQTEHLEKYLGMCNTRKNISLTWRLSNGKWMPEKKVGRYELENYLIAFLECGTVYRYKISGLVWTNEK